MTTQQSYLRIDETVSSSWVLITDARRTASVSEAELAAGYEDHRWYVATNVLVDHMWTSSPSARIEPAVLMPHYNYWIGQDDHDRWILASEVPSTGEWNNVAPVVHLAIPGFEPEAGHAYRFEYREDGPALPGFYVVSTHPYGEHGLNRHFGDRTPQ